MKILAKMGVLNGDLDYYLVRFLGALGSVATFITTANCHPLYAERLSLSAGGFPAVVGNAAFLMKDVVLLAVVRIASVDSVNTLESSRAMIS